MATVGIAVLFPMDSNDDDDKIVAFDVFPMIMIYSLVYKYAKCLCLFLCKAVPFSSLHCGVQLVLSFNVSSLIAHVLL